MILLPVICHQPRYTFQTVGVNQQYRPVLGNELLVALIHAEFQVLVVVSIDSSLMLAISAGNV